MRRPSRFSRGPCCRRPATTNCRAPYRNWSGHGASFACAKRSKRSPPRFKPVWTRKTINLPLTGWRKGSPNGRANRGCSNSNGARAAQRQTAVHQALSGAREQGKILEEALRWGDLARLFERTLSEFPETASELGGRISAARAREADARRKARIAELEHSVTEWIESGLLEEGDEELRVAEREFAGEPVFTRLREALTEERRRLAREAAIKNALDSARRFLERQSFDEAVGVLRATEREFGSDAALSDLSIFAEAAKRTHLAAIQSASADWIAAKGVLVAAC